MAVFINPIEILQLADMDVELIDATILKKAKRQLFAEIDLADHGTLDYKGEALTRNACEAVIDRLDDPRFIAYFHFLANAPLINDFLATGNEAWLAAYQQAPIFADPGFIQFISPQLAPKMDKVLLSAFLREDGPQVQAVLNLKALLVSQDIDHAFRSLSRELQTHRGGRSHQGGCQGRCPTLHRGRCRRHHLQNREMVSNRGAATAADLLPKPSQQGRCGHQLPPVGDLGAPRPAQGAARIAGAYLADEYRERRQTHV
jgi:hypothetical protein